MKTAVFLLLILPPLLAAPAWSQTPGEMVAERARITTERGHVEAAFARDEKACYAKFAVSDCIRDARAARRESLADLRRQEIGLNDFERKQRAAERLRELDARKAARQTRQAGEAAVQAQPDKQGRESRPTRKATEGERAPALPKKKEAQAAREPKMRTEPDTSTNVRRHQERAEQAAEHKAKVEKRAAQANKPVKPLPVPP